MCRADIPVPPCKPLDVQYPLNGLIIDEPEAPSTNSPSITESRRIVRSEESESLVSLVQLPTSTVLEPEIPLTSAAESKSNPSSDTYTASGNSPSSSRLPAHNSTTGAPTTNRFRPIECDISDLIVNGLSRSDEWLTSQTSANSVDILPTVAAENFVPALPFVTAERNVLPRAVAAGPAIDTKSGKHQWRESTQVPSKPLQTDTGSLCQGLEMVPSDSWNNNTWWHGNVFYGYSADAMGWAADFEPNTV